MMQMANSLEMLVKAADEVFLKQFGRPARWLVAAPGRVNLIGEHTDYNDGFVLPMAIERHVVVAADRPQGWNVGMSKPTRLFSAAVQQEATIPAEGPATPGPVPWARYLEGVVAGWRRLGHDAGPFDAVIHSDVPLGGGLSSSAALEVATATLLESLTGVRLEPLPKAFLCQKAEHEFAGVPCGIMDQCASILGRAGALLLLDCRVLTVEPVQLSDPEVVALIVNSNVKHALEEGAYAKRRQQCAKASQVLGTRSLRDVTPESLAQAQSKLDPLLFRRAQHVVTENARTVEAARAIRQGDWDTVGRLMYASHDSLRDDYEVSCPELDLLVRLAAEVEGVIGSRMTGGGFGGCTISLVRRQQLERVMQHLEEGYQRECGRQASLFVTSPADGARVIRTP
jgi:galactokinase